MADVFQLYWVYKCTGTKFKPFFEFWFLTESCKCAVHDATSHNFIVCYYLLSFSYKIQVQTWPQFFVKHTDTAYISIGLVLSF